MDVEPGLSFAPERQSWRYEAASDWDEIKIPLRQWIVPSYLMKGKVSALIGPPEAGKSTVALKWSIALALYQGFGDFRPCQLPGESRRPYRVGILNAEDDENEQRRRISALMRETGRPISDLRDNLVRIRPDHDSAKLFQPGLTSGEIMPTAAFSELERITTELHLDVLILDPLIETMGGADENSNAIMGFVFAALRGLADKLGIAILVIHHVRKGGMAPGSLEAARGAGALGGSVRCAYTLAVMSEDDAEEMGISKDTRRNYVRLDSAKQSYAPPAESAHWFQRFSILLDNGETAPALEPWSPAPIGAVTDAELVPVIAAIKRGPGEGRAYSLKLSAEGRSVKHALEANGIRGKAAQERMLQALREQCSMANVEYVRRNPDGHKQGTSLGLRIDRLPAIEWCDLTVGSAPMNTQVSTTPLGD